MTRDFRHWWLDDAGDGAGDVPRRPQPGKVTLTQSIPVQRRAKPDARPAQKTPPIEAFGFVQAYGGEVKEPAGAAFPDESPVSWLSADADQACRAAFDFDFTPVQRAAATSAASDTEIVHGAAARGLEVPSQGLPHFEQIQKSFGKHDVSHVQAHVGGAAAEASAAMGAEAYAAGDHVAFASAPDLHTAAHEAAHVVQQKGGVQLKGGVGEAGDAYERHADAVADKVVAGESAEALLDTMAAANGPANSVPAVQHRKRGGERGERKATASNAVEVDDAFAFVLDALERGIQARDYFAANEAMREALELVPRVDSLLRPGPARSSEEQEATHRMRVQRQRFETLAPRAPSGGAPSEEERAAWVARTPVSLVRLPEQSHPRPGGAPPTAAIAPSTEKPPITGIPVRPDDKANRAYEEYLGRHWDQLHESARQYFAEQPAEWKSTRLRWAPGFDAQQRASKIVDAIFPRLHIAGQLERLVAPDALGAALDLGGNLKIRDGEGDGDPSWNPSVGTAVALMLGKRLSTSMARMGGQYVSAYDRNGGHVDAANLPWQHAMDGVAAQLLTQEIVRVMGPVPHAERPHAARKPRKWHWLGRQDETLWNWIEVTDPRDASAEDVVLLLPMDVPPFVQRDGGFFRMPEEWARTQPGAAEFAPPSSEVPTGTELAASRFAPRAAIAEAKGQPKVRWTREQFDHAVQEIRGHLNEIGSLIGQQYADRVAAATVVLGAAEGADKALRADLANVFARQEPLLREILEEMQTFHAVSLARGRSRGRRPVEAVYLELALAAGNSHLYSVGRRHLDAARAKAAEVDRELSMEALSSASAGATSLRDAGGAGAEDARDRQRDRFDALVANAPEAGAGHVDTSIDAFVLHTQTLEAQLGAMMDALFATRDRLGPQLGSVFTMGLITAAEELGGAVGDVRDQAAGVRSWLLEKIESSSSPSARQEFLERAQKALGERITTTKIVALSRRVGQMLERVDDADRALQIVNMAIIALEISLISAGAGAAVQAAVTTPGVAAATEAGVMTLGRVGAATAGVVAEATTATLLQVGLLNDNPGEALGENLLGAALSIAALRGFHKVTERFGPFTAENIELWRKLGKADATALRTMHVTLEMALGAGAGYVASEFIRSPVKPTEDEALQMAMQGASIVASHWIMRRMHTSRVHLQEARAGLPADVALRLDATMKSIDELQARAHEIAVTPVDKPVIVDMFAEHHRIIGVEAALVGARDGADAPVAPPPNGKGARTAEQAGTSRPEDTGGRGAPSKIAEGASLRDNDQNLLDGTNEAIAEGYPRPPSNDYFYRRWPRGGPDGQEFQLVKRGIDGEEATRLQPRRGHSGWELPRDANPPDPRAELDRIRKGPRGQIRDAHELSNDDVASALNSQLKNTEATEIDALIDSYPASQREHVRVVMARSSNFGNLESLNALRVAVEQAGAGRPLYLPGSGSLADNLAYVSSKGAFANLAGGVGKLTPTETLKDGSVVILDHVVLQRLSADQAFARALLDNHCVLLEPHGFVSGINMFNAASQTELAARTEKVFRRSQELFDAAKGRLAFPDAVDQALQETTHAALAAANPDLLGRVKVVRASDHADVSSAAIGRQLNGEGGISGQDIADAFASVGLSADQRMYARELLARQSEVFSARGLANELSAHHSDVMAQAAARGVPPENVYFYLPLQGKSYGMLAMAHREATGTAVERYINGPKDLTARRLGRDTLIVILDDVAGSGDSLRKAVKGANDTPFQGHIIVAPMVSTEMARDLFLNPRSGLASQNANLSYSPRRMSEALTESDFYKGLDPDQREELLRVAGNQGFADNALSMVFPYMAPDNNNSLFGDLFARFFIMNRNKKAAKGPRYNAPSSP